MRVLRINKATGDVVNAEEWGTLPADTATERFASSASGGPGWTWPQNGTLTPPVVVDPPAPPVVRRTLPKSTVQERLNTLGKWAAVAGLLYTGGLPNIYYARWFAPDWPNVFADDAGLLQILGYAGLTADEIATVTAP